MDKTLVLLCDFNVFFFFWEINNILNERIHHIHKKNGRWANDLIYLIKKLADAVTQQTFPFFVYQI